MQAFNFHSQFFSEGDHNSSCSRLFQSTLQTMKTSLEHVAIDFPDLVSVRQGFGGLGGLWVKQEHGDHVFRLTVSTLMSFSPVGTLNTDPKVTSHLLHITPPILLLTHITCMRPII